MSSAYKLHRTLIFSVMVTSKNAKSLDLKSELKKLEEMPLRLLVKSKVYDLELDEIEQSFVDQWEEDEEEDEYEDEGGD